VLHFTHICSSAAAEPKAMDAHIRRVMELQVLQKSLFAHALFS
jgi:hypothetical protein